MPLRWFALIFVPMVASQLLRLGQHQPGPWLALDYAGRLAALSLLAAIPEARRVAFAPGRREAGWAEIGLWMAGVVALTLLVAQRVMDFIDLRIPGTSLGGVADPSGWLRVFDMTAGLLLVAAHEEIVFRRCARSVLAPRLGDGAAMVAASTALFAAYHWWTGLGNIAFAAIFGAAAMVALRRIGILWPLVLAHYLVDLLDFYG